MYSLNFIWNQVKDLIKSTLDNEDKSIVYSEFFDDTELAELNDKEAVVLTKYQFHTLILNDNENLNIINDSIKQVLNRNIRCKVLYKDDYFKLKEDLNQINEINRLTDNVMPEYTFENFVHGPSNKEAYAAALAVATNPGRNIYNPLFIYGDSGLGKTHLLCAVGNFIKNKMPEKKILYISSNTFVNQVVISIKNKTIDLLKNQLNSLDVLMMDDIQLLSGKKTSNDVFFDIYNELFNNRKQIILSSDRPPAQIKDIEERLISRFSQGLSVTITTPEYETACKILQMKIKNHGIDENSIDPEVISFLATNFSSDVRSLEGSLNRLLFYSINFSDNTSNKIDINIAMEAFSDNLSDISVSSRDLNVKDIITSVCDYYGLTKQQLMGKSRTKNISNARHMAMYLIRKNLDYSYLKIGEEFGGRDHATVISACEKIDKLFRQNESYKKAVMEIESTFSHRK